jgi:transposase
VIPIEDICWKTANKIFEKQAKTQAHENEAFKMVRYIGLDEFSLKKGHQDFVTVFVDLERHRLITILPYHQKDKLIEYFQNKGAEWCSQIEVFCSDMWDGFINTAKTVFTKAQIVIDRFHFFNQMNQALDSERKVLRKNFKEEADLKNIKYSLLRNYDELSSNQKQMLAKAFQIAPSLKQLHTAKEELRKIFEQEIDKEQAEQKIEDWKEKAQKLENKYLNKFIKTLNNWKPYLLNYFDTRLTTSIIEGMNNKIKMIKRMGFGFTNFTNFKTRILVAFS